MAVTEFSAADVVGLGVINRRIEEYNAMFPVSIANGGTGATTAAQARKNLNIYTPTVMWNKTTSSTTLNTGINEYKYVKITYGVINSRANNSYYWATADATFSVDVMSSTSAQALSIELDRKGVANQEDFLIFVSALIKVSASGRIISLERNNGFIIDRYTGDVSVAPMDIGTYELVDPKIQLLAVTGYK